MKVCLSLSIMMLCGLCACAHRRTQPQVSTDSVSRQRAAIIESAESPPPPQTSTTTTPQSPEKVLRPFDGVTVHLREPAAASFVEVDAETCLDEGYLEQVACSPNSREHESLVVISAKPSQIHAALLLAGFNPGTPGRWTYENETLGTIPPTGDEIDISIRYTDASGQQVEQPIRNWIRGVLPPTSDESEVIVYEEFPDIPWVFGGSQIAANPEFMGPGEHYVADISGSIIGLVTFGDETIGLSRVISDQESVQTPEWEVNSAAVPPMETKVTVILRHHGTEPVHD